MPTGRSHRSDITVRDVAIAAVMAGCTPKAMPILVTAFRALNNPKYNFDPVGHHFPPGGNLVLVSGPIAQKIGPPVNRLHGAGLADERHHWPGRQPGDYECLPFGPGDLRPDCLASQAEFTYCFAEEPELAVGR